MLVFDDLNWADKGSLLLLEFVTRELADAHILLIGTYRDIELSRGHPLSQTLGELARERLFERVLLRGLSPEDVERFIEATCAFAPDQAFVHAVHAQTEGNPFFVDEVVRLLTEEGALTPEALGTPERWSVRIPEGVRETIGRRLDRLSRPCIETLTIASAIGREFALDQLARLVDPSEDRLLELLEEALRAHVIEELPGVGRYQFTHALIQGTLADELSLTRRARLHARIAEALEELYGAEVEAHAAELAITSPRQRRSWEPRSSSTTPGSPASAHSPRMPTRRRPPTCSARSPPERDNHWTPTRPRSTSALLALSSPRWNRTSWSRQSPACTAPSTTTRKPAMWVVPSPLRSTRSRSPWAWTTRISRNSWRAP